MSLYIIPILIIILFVFCLIKRIDAYSSFIVGANNAIKIIFNILPNLASIFILIFLMQNSGLTIILSKFLSPFFNFLHIPTELCEFIILRPFSGSGSLALLNNIFKEYGTDNYISNVACVILGSGDTIFYLSAVIFSGTKVKKIGKTILIALINMLFSILLSCLVCKFI
jgi:spore maturation protein B